MSHTSLIDTLNRESAANRAAGLGGTSTTMVTPDGYSVEVIELNGVATYRVTRDGLNVGGAASFKTAGLTSSLAHVAELLGESFGSLREVTP